VKKSMELFGLAILCVWLAACGGAQSASGPQKLTAAQQAAQDQMDTAVAGANKTAAAYKAMDNVSLITKLNEQSAARMEPFNSPAYRELVGRTDVDPQALVAAVEAARNGDGLLALLLVRKQNQKAYEGIPAEVRAAVLTDALRTEKRFNTWGLPGTYMEDAPKAMIEAGQSGAPALRKLLTDTRPSPMMGAKELSVAQDYHFRVCDYALAYLEKIEGKPAGPLPMALAARDALIREMMK
jgi:hypothetical protein